MSVPQSNWAQGQDFFRDIPVTKIIIVIWAVTTLLGYIAGRYLDYLTFQPVFPFFLTGLVTYSLVMVGIINLLIGGFVFWMFGGSLERGWGSRTYLLFLLVSNIVAALFWALGVWLVTGDLAKLATPWLMLSSVVVAWAWINPEETIMLYFVLPLQAKWVGWLSIIILYFTFPSMVRASGWQFLVLGFFSLGGVAVALGYDWYRRKWAWIPRRREQAPQRKNIIRHPSSTPVGALLRPFREWQRRRRIGQLQRTFNFDDDERKKG